MTNKYIEKRSTLISVPDADTISTSVNVQTSAENAWKLVGDFSGFNKFIDGLIRIEMTGEGVRSVRKKIFEDGSVVIEQLNTIDDQAMIMTWSLIYTSFDINNLWSSMRVESTGNNTCNVIWDIAGEPYSKNTLPSDFTSFLSGFAEDALKNVGQLFLDNSKVA